MEEERQKAEDVRTTCPLCALWSAYKNSEVASHLRAMKREGFMALRCALDWCLHRAGGVARGEGGSR